ncbi:MAG: hypothetical protein IH851_08160 [Armatimonadetes bacterium]|nr:hypothetical protein [Armatimonadota bacterium]
MAVTNYFTVNGEIIGEETGGTQTDYLTDALGSVTATVNQSAAVVNTYRYKPYGGLLAKTGVGADPKFRWVGARGYRQTGKQFSDVYVRARHYSTGSAQWTTADPLKVPLGPANAYAYVFANPVSLADPSGHWPHYVNCPPDLVAKIDRLCSDIFFMGNQKQYLINRCITEASAKIGIQCGIITATRLKCMIRWCTTDGTLTCGPIPTPGGGTTFGRCPRFREWNWPWDDPADPLDELELNLVPPYGWTYATWLAGSGGQVTFLHELMHACRQAHNNSDKLRQCNDIQACCIFEVLRNNNDGHRCVNLI